jgi:hypothetical protein
MNDSGDSGVSAFENIKHLDQDGSEFWLAKELSQVFGYKKWAKFQNVIRKAKLACTNSGNDAKKHFIDQIEIGSGDQRKVADVKLSRYACYLIVQNGDPNKEIIALCQTFIAIQMRKQEIQENLRITDLAAQLFAATQADEKIIREGIKGKDEINQARLNVQQKVRQTIQELGGSLPEELSITEEPIQQTETKKALK